MVSPGPTLFIHYFRIEMINGEFDQFFVYEFGKNKFDTQCWQKMYLIYLVIWNVILIQVGFIGEPSHI